MTNPTFEVHSEPPPNGVVNTALFLNLGCGLIHLPCQRPSHHSLVREEIYSYPNWLNVDKNAANKPDEQVDIFTYPWPWPDNHFGGALLAHIVEHIPHEIKIDPFYLDVLNSTPKNFIILPDYTIATRAKQLMQLQDGWYAFFAELYRVLQPGAIAHILSPYAWSQGAVTDPTHTRLITEHTFTHSLAPDPDNISFVYEFGNINFQLMDQANFRVTQDYFHLVPKPTDDEYETQRKAVQFYDALAHEINVVYDIYARLQAVK